MKLGQNELPMRWFFWTSFMMIAQILWIFIGSQFLILSGFFWISLYVAWLALPSTTA